MDLAVRTTASPAAIWTIVVVAVVLLAFWLIMVMVYANRPDPRYRQLADMPRPVLGEDSLTDLSAATPQPESRVPAQRGPQAPAEPATEPIPAQRTAAGDSAPAETASRPGAGEQI